MFIVPWRMLASVSVCNRGDSCVLLQSDIGGPPPTPPSPFPHTLSFFGITAANFPMILYLIKKSPIKAWVIKQLDEGILHLCGQGVLETNEKPRHVKKALEAGHYHGGVRMGDTGIVLNTRLLAAVVPLDQLKLVANGRIAEWQVRSWAVSQVPQRCWAHEGRLIAERNPMSTAPALISTEDVSGISQHVDRDKAPPGEVVFRPENALEDPLKDNQEIPKARQGQRKKGEKGWRKDGSWGPLDETPEE